MAENELSRLRDKSVRLQQEATFDAVTGLINRGHFAQELASTVARSSRDGDRLALVWIDLDEFKEINDDHGHEAGDRTLRVTRGRVMRSVRGTDSVGRLGGDEIGVLINGYGTTAELDNILERIVASVREPVVFDGQDLQVTASVGVGLFPDDALSPNKLMRAADAAMYAIKRKAGDGYAYFDESMNEAAGARRARWIEMEAAIEDRAFVMHHQPIVDATTGAVWGVEALVRSPREGTIQPAGTFVPFCEESGQIRALGRLTMALVSSDSEALQAAGHTDLQVAFNMSITQLEDPHFDDFIHHCTRPDGLRGLVVEILESVLAPNHGKALERVGQLSRLGAETSLDDYGSGCSSIRLLEALGPDYIKLDGSFLSEHHTTENRAALMRSAVDMSHVVGSRVVAEGIETIEQRALATAAGVDLVQGFEIARPMPLQQLLEWLANHSGSADCPSLG